MTNNGTITGGGEDSDALTLGPYAGAVEQRADGCWILRSLDPLRAYPERFTEHLARWAHERRDNVFLLVHARLLDLLEYLATRASGGSQRIVRALILDQPPSVAAGEIIDKGTINQRAVMQARQAAVELLYSSASSACVVVQL